MKGLGCLAFKDKFWKKYQCPPHDYTFKLLLRESGIKSIYLNLKTGFLSEDRKIFSSILRA